MRLSLRQWALPAVAFSMLAGQAVAQTATATALGAIKTLACYQSVEPLTKDNTDTFQTDGLCQKTCGNAGHAVMAITGGTTCYCGDMLPALDQQVSQSNCNAPCSGYNTTNCGGLGFWQVYLTGLTGDVTIAPNTTTTTTSSSSTIPSSSIASPSLSSSSSATSTTRPAETVVVTQPATSAPVKENNGPNKVGIAVGVVVGVIVLAAVGGAAVFFMRQKRRKEIEEEHKRAAAANAFSQTNKPEAKAATDQRLDPTAFGNRRESIGSIADERDFSRRILQVRNPDRGSMNSTMA